MEKDDRYDRLGKTKYRQERELGRELERERDIMNFIFPPICHFFPTTGHFFPNPDHIFPRPLLNPNQTHSKP